jgi:hypothetical protein
MAKKRYCFWLDERVHARVKKLADKTHDNVRNVSVFVNGILKDFVSESTKKKKND